MADVVGEAGGVPVGADGGVDVVGEGLGAGAVDAGFGGGGHGVFLACVGVLDDEEEIIIKGLDYSGRWVVLGGYKWLLVSGGYFLLTPTYNDP
ncbi:hypothetical protein [Micrococcus terreus]|uniref:hypothetical protein n=1 Tax=Micrococcus terreus TaxID=574650 RepID=UPI003D71CE6A